MHYKVVFIDWDGTLSGSRFWERWRGTPQYELIQSKLFGSREGKLIIRDWMLGLRDYKSVLSYLTEATTIPYNELARELQYSAENMQFIDQQALEKIRLLREYGVKVLIATDNMDTFRLWTMPALGIESLFDGVLASDIQGAMKSYLSSDGVSLFFAPYFLQNDLAPQNMVLIDDSIDTKVVEKFGMNFMHVDDKHSLTFHLDNILKEFI